MLIEVVVWARIIMRIRSNFSIIITFSLLIINLISMSGHSKWATTKRKKAAIDSKRAQIFTKLAKVITIAARDGGTDPSTNSSLRMAVDNAKAASMPKENIERAINRGDKKGDAASIEEITYEAYGPGKTGLLIECLTDNKNRAISEIKAVLNKSSGSMAGAGSVSYNFARKGEIVVDLEENGNDISRIENAILESEADDYSQNDGMYLVDCNFSDLKTIKDKIESLGVKVSSAESVMTPMNTIEVEREDAEKLENLVESLEDLDDVNRVYTNSNL
jgi:YebC/PmpR family DNA-binding regulatory protein